MEVVSTENFVSKHRGHRRWGGGGGEDAGVCRQTDKAVCDNPHPPKKMPLNKSFKLARKRRHRLIP